MMLADEALFAARCDGCGALSFPARCVCATCGGTRFSPIGLCGLDGVVLSFTVVYALPPGLARRPLRLALVELRNGLRALGHLDCDAPRFGLVVRATCGPVRIVDGHPTEGLIFVETK